MSPVEFKAPWARSLRISTIVSIVAFIVIAAIAWLARNSIGLAWAIALIGIPIAMLFATLPCMVRGYRLTEHEIQVKRLGWTTTLPLATLVSIAGKADAMQGSFRVFGNGGVFSLTGFFWNRQLKFYRAYATDPSRAVILRYTDRVVVITPHDPQHFIVRARTLLKTAGFSP
jgi:hypothetical protein